MALGRIWVWKNVSNCLNRLRVVIKSKLYWLRWRNILHSSDYYSIWLDPLIELNLVWNECMFTDMSLSSSTAPINIAYTTKHKYVFKDGYFFTVAPGYYKTHEYGIRLKNVFEVIDTHDMHFSGAKFLAFRVATLVPFETKLIDRSLLSLHEVRKIFVD